MSKEKTSDQHLLSDYSVATGFQQNAEDVHTNMNRGLKNKSSIRQIPLHTGYRNTTQLCSVQGCLCQ
jgi:hypothetical protein